MIIGDVAAAGPMGNQAAGAYQAHAPPRLTAVVAEAGGCRFEAARPALCEPACTGAAVCDAAGRCVEFPDNLAAGTLRITGTTPPLTLDPRPGNSYYADTTYPGLYRPGDAIGFDLAGADGIAPLAATVVGVPAIAPTSDRFTAIEHQDLAIRWPAITTPVDAEVVIHLDSDHHGIEAFVECAAPAAAGEVIVPAAILDQLILAGETGIGTYIENAWIEVRQRALRSTERGCAAIDAYADHFLSIDTVRAP